MTRPRIRGYGRKVEHDPASRKYPARMAPAPGTKIWDYRGPLLDQDGIGGCVGWTRTELFNTAPFYPLRRRWHRGRFYGNDDALRAYHDATLLDAWDGEYPPDDTGTSGLAVAKAAKADGLITRYEHVFGGLSATVRALQLAPGMLGINWYETMDFPDDYGTVRVGGDVVAGHEVTLLGYDARRRALKCLNHWPGWGVKQRFWIPDADADRLLHEDGDVTIIPLDAMVV